MEQLKLYFEKEELNELRGLVPTCYAAVKKKYPAPIKGETLDEYNDFVRDETLLEIADRLTEIALRKQKRDISILYKGINYEEE